MVLLQYRNLLLHRASAQSSRMEIIGEEQSALNASIVQPGDGNDEEEYMANFVGVKVLSCKYDKLSALPAPSPGLLDALECIDISGCTSITRIPAAFGSNGTVTTLNVSNTKVSSIPLTFSASVRALDVSQCRRITNVGDMHHLQVLNITASAVLDISVSIASTLEQIIALNSKITCINDAPNLKVVLWSGASHLSLEIGSASIALMTVVTTNSIDRITCPPNAYVTALSI